MKPDRKKRSKKQSKRQEPPKDSKAEPTSESKPAAPPESERRSSPPPPGESETVSDPSLSCRVQTIEPEPKASVAYPSVGLVCMIVVLLYFGQLYLHQHGGGFHAQVYEPFASIAHVRAVGPMTPEEALLARGRVVYQNVCNACHQMTGQGLPGQFPPLAGAEWVLVENPGRPIRIVLHGLTGPIEVRGEMYNASMVGFDEDLLSSEDVAAVLSYVRSSWGNQASLVTPEQVEMVRQETAGRNIPWTAPELLQVSPE